MNKLRTHLKRHANINLVSGDKGGREGQKVIDEGIGEYFQITS